MKQLETIFEKARRQLMRIVLCEVADPRVQEAARRAAADGLAHIIMVGSGQDESSESAATLEFIDPENSPWREAFERELLALRQSRGMTASLAAETVCQPLIFAMLMVRLGYADGSVAGADHTTADVVRSAIQIVGMRPSAKVVSSFFIMIREEPFLPDTQAMIFSDCGLVIDPNAEELAEIALSSAHSASTLLGLEPRVAMLSFSTRGSAVHQEVDKVRRATELAQVQAPHLAIDGEMQLDTAIVPQVADRKWPESHVAGKANVLIFPNLAAGNIGYKLCERLGHSTAIGPLLQGLNKPANDLSRGCSVEDIYNVIAVTAVQAQSRLA